MNLPFCRCRSICPGGVAESGRKKIQKMPSGQYRYQNLLFQKSFPLQVFDVAMCGGAFCLGEQRKCEWPKTLQEQGFRASFGKRDMGGHYGIKDEHVWKGTFWQPPFFWQCSGNPNYAPHLYRRTFLASKLRRKGNPAIRLPFVLQYASHLYGSTPPSCTAVPLEKYWGLGSPERFWFLRGRKRGRAGSTSSLWGSQSAFFFSTILQYVFWGVTTKRQWLPKRGRDYVGKKGYRKKATKQQ